VCADLMFAVYRLKFLQQGGGPDAPRMLGMARQIFGTVTTRTAAGAPAAPASQNR